MDITKYEKLANIIPSQGGRQIGKHLRTYSRQITNGSSIVETGTWLGAGTAQLALGQIEVKHNAPIYCYDKFKASKQEVYKASLQNCKLKEKEDTLPVVKNYLNKIYNNIIFNKIDLKYLKYNGPEIGLWVDDACKREEKFLHVINNLEPFFKNGTIIVLMDYYFFKKRNNVDFLKFQYNFTRKRKNNFEFIESLWPKSSAAIFIYRR